MIIDPSLECLAEFRTKNFGRISRKDLFHGTITEFRTPYHEIHKIRIPPKFLYGIVRRARHPIRIQYVIVD